MSVELSDEQYGMLLHGLSFIASGRRYNSEGDLRRIPRDELVNRAREMCGCLHIHYVGDGTKFSGYEDAA